MGKGWKLWPKGYEYRFQSIIWGVGFDIVIMAFIMISINDSTEFYINGREATLGEFLLPVGAIMLIGVAIVALGFKKNLKVYRLRKELKFLKDNFTCYDGTISEIERLQVNDVIKKQANNIHNRYTRILNKVVVEYIDEDGRKRIATSEEYGEYLSVFLKDTKAKVYVSKNGNNRIVDELSWRQTSKDEYIDVPGVETMSKFIKKAYYRLCRMRVKIQIGSTLIAFIIIGTLLWITYNR